MRARKLNISSWLPAGSYTYALSALTESNAVTSTDSFTFEKEDDGTPLPSEAVVSLSATPADSTPVVTSAGENIVFERVLTNLSAISEVARRWEIIRFPDGSLYAYSTVAGVSLGAGKQSRQATRKLAVPAWFPPGDYTYTYYANTKTNAVVDSASFTFTKAE